LLVRITWILVVAALGTLIGGFFTPDSNVLLFVAIGLALSVIVLVLFSWARRAREGAPYAFDEDLAFADEEEAGDEELFAALETGEEFAVGGPRARTARRRPAGKTSKSKAKGKARAKAKTQPRAKSSAKPTAARKAGPKAGGGTATRSKAKPRAPRPSSEPSSEPESAPE
jgi:hypothetical protein